MSTVAFDGDREAGMTISRDGIKRVRRNNRRGQIIVLVTLSLFAMGGMMGLAVDLGWSYYAKKWQQAAADGAALAAAQAALEAVGPNGPFTCARLTCRPEPAPCPGSPANPPANNLDAGCLYAMANGFTVGGNQGRQNVLLAANTTSPPPTAPGVNVYYWTTARVSESIPQLFSSLLGNKMGLVSARATAGITDAIFAGGLFTLNRENDPSTTDKKSSVGMDLFTQGGGLIDAEGGIWMASTANGQNGTYAAGHAGGSATVIGGPFINIRGTGAVDNPGNFTPTPTSGLGDLTYFQDPMRGLGQPPPPTGLPDMPVLGGTINGDCNNPTVLSPGNYYATAQSKKGGGIVATGLPITVTGCLTFSSGTGGFGGYVFFGGLSFPSTHTVVTFHPGRYVVAGALPGNPVFWQHTGVTLTDNTPLTANGESQSNTDAGELFIFTDTNYPGLQVPSMVQAIQDQLQFGTVQVQMGNNDGSLVNLHGLNKLSDNLPSELKAFAPALFWQDQQNSQVVYKPDGTIDTSCGGSLSKPCLNTDPRIAPQMDLQAHPNLHLYGLLYQPRGAWMVFQGNGTLEAPMQIVTGFLSTTGSSTVTLTRLPNPFTRRVVALLE